MKSKTAKIALIAALLLILAGIVALQVRRLSRPRDFNVRVATLTRIDAATRSGAVEFVHPKSGRIMQISAERIPADCRITVNGAPADVSALRVGDQAAIEGTFYPRQRLAIPRAIHVQRPADAAPTSSPAESQAGATPAATGEK